MAKGDSGGAGMGVPQAPKQDQYSVMHKIMDGMAGTMAPSVMPRSPDQGQMGMEPNSNQFGGMTPGVMSPNLINFPQNPNVIGGRFNAGMGMPRMDGVSMAPTNPQDMMRRTIMGKGSFGQ